MKWMHYVAAAVLLFFITILACNDDNSTGPEKPTTGSISVLSEPSGAKIYLNGVYKGRTPDTLTGIKPGGYTLKLTLQHHADWQDSVKIEVGITTSIHVKLISMVGSILVNSDPSGARIYLDGLSTLKSTLDTLTNVGVGLREIKLLLYDYNDWIDTIRVGSDSLTIVDAILVHESGMLIVNSTPGGASIWLDDENTVKVTPDTMEVSTGSHNLKLTLENYKDYTRFLYISKGETKNVHAWLNLICPGGIIGDLNLPPEIQIIGLEPGHNIIHGIANNIDASKIRVVMWARTDIWYVQPYIARPYTEICADGSWKNSTHPWTRMVVLLVDSTYIPGATRNYHPASDTGVLAWDEYPEPSGDRYLNFSDYRWRVKNADLAGPGPNYFSDSESNVWLDAIGLHLKFDYRGGKWYCAEVVLDHSLGYGVYTFQLDARVDSLNYNAVFAGFVYESGSREIDIEFSQLLSNPYNAQYVIQPWNVPGNIEYYDMPATTQSTHRFEWRSDKIIFTSWTGHDLSPAAGNTIHTWTYTGSDTPPPGGERMRFNLWLFNGNPPTSGTADEVVVKSFSYQE
jgi:hypothetical protein